jgi:hypothetical protein
MDLGNTVIFYWYFITYNILTLTESCRDIALYDKLSTESTMQTYASDVIRVTSSRVMNMYIGGSETDTWTIFVECVRFDLENHSKCPTIQKQHQVKEN